MLATDPQNADALKVLTSLAIQNQDWLEGARWGYQLVQLKPQDIDSLLLLAQCLIGGEEKETAREVLEEVLKLNPTHELASTFLSDLAPSHLPDSNQLTVPEEPGNPKSNVDEPGRKSSENTAAFAHLKIALDP